MIPINLYNTQVSMVNIQYNLYPQSCEECNGGRDTGQIHLEVTFSSTDVQLSTGYRSVTV